MNIRSMRMILKACAEDSRLRIINLLDDRELTVKDIGAALKMKQPMVSKHLTRMRLLRVVVDRREGNMVFYRLTKKEDTFQYRITQFLISEFKQSSIERQQKAAKTSSEGLLSSAV